MKPHEIIWEKILFSWISIKTQNNIEEKSSDHKKVYMALIKFLDRLQLRIQDVKLLGKNNKKHACLQTLIAGFPDERSISNKFYHNQNKVSD